MVMARPVLMASFERIDSDIIFMFLVCESAGSKTLQLREVPDLRLYNLGDVVDKLYKLIHVNCALISAPHRM
jgi:hypothetical protein